MGANSEPVVEMGKNEATHEKAGELCQSEADICNRDKPSTENRIRSARQSMVPSAQEKGIQGEEGTSLRIQATAPR